MVWICRGCGAAYSVGAPCCPQCRTNDPIKEAEQLEQEREEMAKITVHGGPSNADDEQPDEVVEAQATADETEQSAAEAESTSDTTADKTAAEEKPKPATRAASRRKE